MDNVNNNFINYIVKKVGVEETNAALKKLNDYNKMFSDQVPKATKVMSESVSYSLNKQGQTIQKTATIWQDSTGKIRQSAFKLTESGQMIGATTGEVSKKTKGLFQVLYDLGKRALFTIPIWYAMRAALNFVRDGIRDAINYFIKLDKAIARVKAVVTDFKGTSEELTKVLGLFARSLAIQTGESTEKILEIFHQLSTSGLNFALAMKGTTTVLKTSIGMMGDASELAKVGALAYNMLGKTIKGNYTEFEKFNMMQAASGILWRKNQFEVNEMSAAMKKSAASMSVANVDGRAVLAMLATLHQNGVKGAQAGTMLAVIFDMLAKNANKLQKELGIVVKEGETTDWFKLLTTIIEQLNKTGEATPEVIQKIIAIFQQRGARAFRPLKEDLKGLQENLRLVYQELPVLMAEIEKLYKIQEHTVSVQIERYKMLKNEMFAAFITGFVGAKDYASALEVINKKMIQQVGIWYALGVTMKKYQRAVAAGAVPGAIVGGVPGAIVGGTIGVAAKSIVQKATGEESFIEEFINAYEKMTGDLVRGVTLETNKELEEQLKKVQDLIDKFRGDQKTKEEEITDEFLKRLEVLQLERKYFQDELYGATELELKYRKLVDTVRIIVDYHDKGIDIYGNLIEKVSEERIITALIKGDVQEIVNLKKEGVLTEQEAIDLLKQAREIEQTREETAKKYGETLKKAYTDSFQAFLSGTATINEALTSLGENIRRAFSQAISEGLTTKLFKATGIGGIFGNIMSEVEMMGTTTINISSITGSQYYANAIIQSSLQGAQYIGNAITTAMTTGGVATAPIATGIAGGVAGAAASVISPVGRLFTPQIPQATSQVSADKAEKAPTATSKLGKQPFTVMGGLMTGFTGAMMNYGQGAGAMALSGVGSMLMAYGGPVGWAVGGLMMLGSLFAGKKKREVTTTSTWQPEEVKDMFPMIGMDIAPLPKLWPLARSHYFGRTGGIQVNININKIEGTDKNIAEKIAEQVQINISKTLPVDYRRGIERGEMANKLIF